MPFDSEDLRDSSVPNPKFATLSRILSANFGFDKDTSKFLFLVWFSVLKFPPEFAANNVRNFKTTTLGNTC